MEEFLRKIEDLYKRCINRNVITYTGFLTPAERQLFINKFSYAKIAFFGGVDEAERVRAFFLPEYLDSVIGEEYITAIKVTFSFKELSHRDFLGAILSLGIERRCLGDIYVFNKEAYFFVTSDIADYVMLNLTKVGSVGVKLKKIDFLKVRVTEPNFKEVDFSVPSLRLDSVASGSTKLSREKIITLIKSGEVLVNYLVCDNPSKILAEKDIFSVKGYGKFCLTKIGGESRRGKIFVKVNKYV